MKKMSRKSKVRILVGGAILMAALYIGVTEIPTTLGVNPWGCKIFTTK